MKRIALMLLVMVSLICLAAQSRQPEPNKIQALIVTGQNGHDWRGTTPILRRILDDSGVFSVRVTEEFRGAGPETLVPYDLVVLNYYDLRKPELRWGARAEDALLDFVRSGKGLVIYHFSVAAFDGWAEYEKMCGGNWRPNNGHHSPAHDFQVEVKEPDHPVLRGLKPSFTQSQDELYANLRWQPAGTYRVLATAWDDHSLYKGKARQPIPGDGMHHPVLWTVDYGKGRVIVTVLGHDVAAVQTPVFVTTFARGAEWAATGKVSLGIPAELAR